MAATSLDRSEALRGIEIVVLGAGLAGLAAARDLEAAGASVVVVEARDRVGGRVHTLRKGFAEGQHAEAGADLIEASQSQVRELAVELGLTPTRILRRGWAFYGSDNRGRRRVRSSIGAFGEAQRLLVREVADYQLSGERWDSVVARNIARRSVADWMHSVHADASLQAGLRGLRGFFLADPEDLSLLALVDQVASTGLPGGGSGRQEPVFRLSGGNETLPRAIAKRLRARVKLRHAVRRVHQRNQSVAVTCEHRGAHHELRADFCVAAMPASTLRDVLFDPPLPDRQSRAINTLRYGRATRLLLQFERRFWRGPVRPNGFGSDLPTGAVWDGNEEQRGRAGVLSLLAGGNASLELQAILEAEGPAGAVRRLSWMASTGRPAPLLASQVVVWDDDPWVKGGYAVFDPSFDPMLREWVARPAGRIVFAGEHTSHQWQGYMNGAIESGRRAAAEIRALHQAGAV
jgi:monoamine oxidase